LVSNDPQIADAILLPTNPRTPRFDRIGYRGLPVQSLATTVLVLAVFLAGSLPTRPPGWCCTYSAQMSARPIQLPLWRQW
jgi:hypothetical protein